MTQVNRMSWRIVTTLMLFRATVAQTVALSMMCSYILWVNVKMFCGCRWRRLTPAQGFRATEGGGIAVQARAPGGEEGAWGEVYQGLGGGHGSQLYYWVAKQNWRTDILMVHKVAIHDPSREWVGFVKRVILFLWFDNGIPTCIDLSNLWF
jgi:hypothetical protein